MKGKQRRRISEADVSKALILLDGWCGKLTWKRFLAIFSQEVGYLYTRSAMRKYPRITDAYSRAKHRIREQVETVSKTGKANGFGIIAHGDVALAKALEKIELQKQTIIRLEQENRDLLEQFLRWQYNACITGLTEEALNRPMPGNHRD